VGMGRANGIPATALRVALVASRLSCRLREGTERMDYHVRILRLPDLADAKRPGIAAHAGPQFPSGVGGS
jgi:hypothetical protein